MTSKRVSHQTLEILRQANNQSMLSVRNNSIILYNQYIGDRNKNKTTFQSNQKEILQTYTGIFTQSAKQNMRKAIEVISLLNPKEKKLHPVYRKLFYHSLSFVTLTIPDNTLIHPTTAYTLLLRPFLQYITKTHKCKYYIWKLEYQSRGQIHYHLTTDLILHWKIIRDKWNYLLNKNNLMSNYKEEYNNTNPNSIDIHKVYKVNSMVMYLQKEFLKSMQNNSPYGSYTPLAAAPDKFKTWDCSVNIKSTTLFKTELDYDQEQYLKYSSDESFGLSYKKVCDNCTVYIPNGIKSWELLTDNNKMQYAKYISFARNENKLL